MCGKIIEEKDVVKCIMPQFVHNKIMSCGVEIGRTKPHIEMIDTELCFSCVNKVANMFIKE